MSDVELAFPRQSPNEGMREGYMRRDLGVTTEQQFHNCINYGKSVFRIHVREAGYEAQDQMMIIHRLVMHEDFSTHTRCGIRLSNDDTMLTYAGVAIDTTHFDARITCPDCRDHFVRVVTPMLTVVPKRPKLSVVR